jgi:hypothetical protein
MKQLNMSHIDEEVLESYFRKRPLENERVDEIEEHLLWCSHCQAEAERTLDFLDTLELCLW